jgi:hypothetical protein
MCTSTVYFVTKIIITRVGQGYSAHFKFEAMKDGMEHVLKKLHPVQNAGNFLPFLPQLTQSKQILLYSQN